MKDKLDHQSDDMFFRVCKECGELMHPDERPNKKFCSVRCRVRFFRRKRRIK